MATVVLLSNVDLIRRFVFEHQPVGVDAIVAEVRKQMHSVKSDEAARDKYVLPVLRNNVYYREVEPGVWIAVREEMPEYKVLEDVFREEHQLLYEREVKSRVAAKLGMKVACVVLDLTQAEGLERFGSLWGLKGWVLANDQAAEVLSQHPMGLTDKDLLKLVCERFHLDPKMTIFHLAGDKQKRFVPDRKVWVLKALFDSRKAPEEKPLSLPELKDKSIDLELEGSFLLAQTAKGEDSRLSESAGKSRLKKALKKQAIDIIEQREEAAARQDDLAARLSQVFSAAGIDEYGVKSFQRVEPAQKERGLNQKEREDIQQFIDQLLEQETVSVGAPLLSVVNAPLSARKMLDVLRLKYINYTRDRAVIPNEYYRLLVEVIAPTINDSVLHPACFEGNLSIELFGYLFDHLEGSAWTLTDEGNLEIVQPDGAHYRLTGVDAALVEQARDKFIVSQTDLLNHYLNYKYTGIEPDKVLARAARVVTRLSGYESAYIVSRDYLSELPEVFGLPANDDNSIPMRFDRVIGNFTFSQDANLAANYLDQSLKLLNPQGSCAVFVLQELLSLLKEHALLGEFLKGIAVTHFIRLPLIEGRHKVVLLAAKSFEGAVTALPPITVAEIRDFKSANNLSYALQKGEGEGELYERVEPLALGNIIG